MAGRGTSRGGRARRGPARRCELIDLRRHEGVHPRLGALDVVPFVPLDSGGTSRSAGGDLGRRPRGPRPLRRPGPATSSACPASSTGPSGACPRCAARPSPASTPTPGPPSPIRRAGACAVGARFALVAYNLWLTTADLAVARSVAARRPGPGGAGPRSAPSAGSTQVSCNLVDPFAVGPGPGLRRRATAWPGRPAPTSPGPSWSAWPRPRWSRPRRRTRWRQLDLDPGPDRRGPPGGDHGAVLSDGPRLADRGGRRLRRPTPSAATRRLMARARRRRRRSRSDSPPQIPNFSPLASAYSRQSSRTTHPRQTSLASRVDAPRSGKKRSGSTPMQLALVCQSRSWRPYSSETMSTGTPPLAI